jgi:hypothetical protein
MAPFLRLRQICLVAADLQAVETRIVDTLGVPVCYRDPGVGKYGLHNALFALGGTFLEVVAPTRADTAAGRYLQRRHGDGGYMFIVDVDDVGPWRTLYRELGVRIVEDIDRTGEGGRSQALHLHPRDTGGCILSVDQHSGGADMFGEYLWAGPDWRSGLADGPFLRIEGADIQTADPEGLSHRWSELFARKASVRAGAAEIRLDQGYVRFVGLADERGEGLSAVTLSCTDVQAAAARAERAGLEVSADGFNLAGVRFHLVAAA